MGTTPSSIKLVVGCNSQISGRLPSVKLGCRQRSLQCALARSASGSFGSPLRSAGRYYAYRTSAKLAFPQPHLVMSTCEILMKHHDGLLDRK